MSGALNQVAVDDRELPGPVVPVPARTYTPVGVADAPGLVWVHGGGFVMGDLDMPEADHVARLIAARGVAVVSLDYRKAAAGVRHPVPLDDVDSGWAWVVEHAPELGMSADALHLGGASAGAALATATALRCRDRGARGPASLVLVYPFLHAELPEPGTELTALLREAGPEVIDAEIVRNLSLNYVGAEDRFDDPEAFPGSADVRGLSPVLVIDAEVDGLRATGERFAEQLAEAGVVFELHTEPSTEHGYLNEPSSPATPSSVDRIIRWIVDGPMTSRST